MTIRIIEKNECERNHYRQGVKHFCVIVLDSNWAAQLCRIMYNSNGKLKSAVWFIFVMKLGFRFPLTTNGNSKVKDSTKQLIPFHHRMQDFCRVSMPIRTIPRSLETLTHIAVGRLPTGLPRTRVTTQTLSARFGGHSIQILAKPISLDM
jgi:hypothetical protein